MQASSTVSTIPACSQPNRWGRNRGTEYQAYTTSYNSPMVSMPGHEFDNFTMTQAIDTTINQFYDSTQNNRCSLAISRMNDILGYSYNHSTMDDYSKEVFIEGYNFMLYAHRTGVANGEITQPTGGALNSITQEVIEVQNHLLNGITFSYVDSTMYNTRFRFHTDKVLTYSQVGVLSSALTEIDNINNWVHDGEQSIIDYLECHLEFENMIKTDTTGLLLGTDTLYACQDTTGSVPYSESLFNLYPIQNKNLEPFSLYPNPAQNQLVLQKLTNRGFESITYSITNANGQIVAKQNNWLPFNTNQLQIPISDLPDGLFLLKVHSESGTHILRFVVQK
ncbi:MAG: T9SS type A sorting domain-containing protein [Bacteroidetes bacterium]|nr:T9SS type A sorting domain-containing protein [Bacteroidota bacterium]